MEKRTVIITLNLAQVEELTNLKKSTIYKLMQKGEFPLRMRLSPGRVGWLQHEVLDWINEKVKIRDKARGIR